MQRTKGSCNGNVIKNRTYIVHTVHTMVRIRKNFRFKNITVWFLETVSKSTGLDETEVAEKSIEMYYNSVIKNVQTPVQTIVHTTQNEAVVSTPIITHTHTRDSNVLNISDRGLKGGNSFFHDENGNEVPLPPSSPELDAKQKETEEKWRTEYEADLKRRGINP